MSRIAIVVPTLGGGGAERVMVTLANEFGRAGHQVEMVVFQRGGVYAAELDTAVVIRCLDSKRVLRSLLPMVRYLRRAKPDAVLSVMNHVNILCIVASLFIRPRPRIVISERNSPSGELQTGFTAGAIRLLMKILYRKSSAAIAVSRGVAQQLSTDFAMPSERVHAIPNPIDVEAVNALAGVQRPPTPVKDGRRTLVAMGRLEKQKDFETLIKALGILARSEPNVDLLVLGEGTLQSHLSDIARGAGVGDRVHFLGFQTNPFPWLATADVFVLSSRWEGFPNAILQALALNIRVVSTDCHTGPSEILSGGDGQRLVPVGNPAAMADALLSELGRTVPPTNVYAVTQYAPISVARAYLEVLLGEPKRGA